MMCQHPLDFHPFGVGMKLEALSTWGNAAHTGETLLLPGWSSNFGAPWLQWSPHHSKNWATFGDQNEWHSSH